MVKNSKKWFRNCSIIRLSVPIDASKGQKIIMIVISKKYWQRTFSREISFTKKCFYFIKNAVTWKLAYHFITSIQMSKNRKFWAKIEILGKNRNLGQKGRHFLTYIEMLAEGFFGPKLNFCSKLEISSKILNKIS